VHENPFSESLEYVVDAIAPIVNSGEPWGFACVSVSLTDIVTNFNRNPPVRSSYSFLLDADRRLVASTPQARVDLAPPSADLSAGVIDMTATGSPTLDAALTEMAFGGAAVRRVSAKGDEKYLAFRPLDTAYFRVGVLVSVPMVTTASQQLSASIDATMREGISRMLLVTGLFFLLAMLLGVWLARRLAEPLHEMAAVTERIAQGDFSARVSPSSTREISTLGGAVNAMAARLQGLVDDLARRAAELAGANDALVRQAGLLESVLHNMGDAVVGADTEGRVLVWNPAAERLLGPSPSAARVAERAGCFLPDQTTEVPAHDLPLARAARGDVVDQVEMFIQHERIPDGAWVSITGRPLRMQDGTQHGGVVVLRDITMAKRAEETLRRANDELEARVKERTAELKEAQRQLIETARAAGMAEVATNVLHNVGNVLHSVTTAASVVSATLRGSRVTSVRRVADLLKTHESDLAGFFTQHDQGRKLPSYLALLADKLDAERDGLLAEVMELGKNVDHIHQIIRVQQRYATGTSMLERTSPSELIDDALRITATSLSRQGIEVAREVSGAEHLLVDKHKVLQILTNLVSNAVQALARSGASPRRLLIRAASGAEQGITFEVTDNGVGISAENMTRIFHFGFTTRQDGHGFGLHSSALFARTMGGSLTATSEGEGKGATFILTLPRTE
jgi:PAS domain S-box-containing protein